MSKFYDTASPLATRLNVPMTERIKQLYVFGRSPSQILDIVKAEFEDIEINPITSNFIKDTIMVNRESFERGRLEYAELCRNELKEQVAFLFKKTQQVENRMVEVFSNKLNEALTIFAGLDLEEKDDDGNYKQTSRFFLMMEACDKLQTKIAKVAGTEILRELEAFRQKSEIQAALVAAKANGGMMPAHGRTVSDEPIETTFIE